MNKTGIFWLVLTYCFSFVSKAAIDAIGYEVISTARAGVAGINYIALRRDRNFRRAIEYIVQNCSVNDDSISC